MNTRLISNRWLPDSDPADSSQVLASPLIVTSASYGEVVAAAGQTFAQTERQRASAWKLSSSTVPDQAREPAPYVRQASSMSTAAYPFCVPAEYATVSLLPEVRQVALALFVELGIPWHAGIGGGPGNHLLSSQVQCVNALGQMVHDPDRLVRAFCGVVGTAEVLEIEPGRFLTFEYIGDTDYFGEAHGGVRTRGAHCTSVDAAFVHRTVDGVVELVLVEWKYIESYRPRTIDPAKDEVRWQRYGAALTDPDGPVRDDLLAFSDLLDEPLYQLMRQQLLAYELERDRVHDVDRVRVVHVHPTLNLAYQRSLRRDTQLALGSTVGEVWAKLLRHPDRYVEVDNSVFADPEVTSLEYVARYGSADSAAGISTAASTENASLPSVRPATHRDSVVARRNEFNDHQAPAIAEQLGFPPRWSDPALSSRFAFFADDEHLAVVAGPQEHDAVELALAYAIRHAHRRSISLVLPWDRLNATAQRIPWLRRDARPVLYQLDQDGSVALVPSRSTSDTVRALLDRLDQDPGEELAHASTPLHLGGQTDSVWELVEQLTVDGRLDHAHRRGERSWQYAGQRVLSIRRSVTGLVITAGVHYTGDNAPEPVEVPADGTLSDTQQVQIVAAIEAAISERRDGAPPIHRPDEHWLQSVIRRTPSIVGVEQPAIRELPAWRPRDRPSAWGRGFIDLIGLDGHGNIRIVETKLATNADDLLVLQGLDYLVWAHAYEHALRDRLGAPRNAPIELHFVLGANPTNGDATVSPCTEPLAAALDPESVRWRFQTVHDWYAPPDATTGTRSGRRWYDVERVAAPGDLDNIDAEYAADVFGEQAEWGYALPAMYRTLAEPQAGHPMPRRPQHSDDPLPATLGYWSALLHLLVYRLGWARPDLGLRWWYDAGKPTDDPTLAMLAEVWDDDGRLDWFAAWLWTSALDTYLPEPNRPDERRRVDVDRAWLSRVKEQIDASDVPAPYAGDGGSDPLHLNAHIDGPLQCPRIDAAQLHISDADQHRATLATISMTGWYRALLDATSSTALDTVDVIVVPAGHLGTYRRSPITGLWHTGRHDLHLHGNEPLTATSTRRSSSTHRASRFASRFEPTPTELANPLIEGLVVRLGDRLVGAKGTIPSGCLQLLTTHSGVSLRAPSPIASGGTLSLMASPGGQTSVHFPGFDKMTRYLPGHQTAIETFTALMATLGCDLRVVGERRRVTLPVKVVIDHVDTIAAALERLATDPTA